MKISQLYITHSVYKIYSILIFEYLIEIFEYLLEKHTYFVRFIFSDR